ncbi:MAG: hypothetical protein QXO65_02680 [Candidatus Aenigmatarchaeota archaeon]
MKNKITFLTILMLILSVFSISIFAGLPQQITLQGRLTDKTGFPVTSGTYTFGFSIYDAPEKGNLLWSETQENIYVDENGIVNIILGKNNPINLNWDKPYYLEINFTSRQMRTVEVFKPRYNITSSPYSFSSKNLLFTDYPINVNTNNLTAISGTGSAEGLHGEAGPGGTAVYGLQTGGSMGTGVLGKSTASNGTGVYGEGYYGVFGNGTAVGVFGFANNSVGGRPGIGVKGVGNSYGIFAEGIGYATGLYAIGSPAIQGKTNSDNEYGLYIERGKAYFQGKVGIGIENPAEKLSVNGSTKIQGNLSVENGYLIVDKSYGIIMNSFITNGRNKIWGVSAQYPDYGFSYYEGTPDYFAFHPNGSPNSPNMVIRGDSKVGIGTANPQQALDVVGNLNVTQNRYWYGGTNIILINTTNSTEWSFDFPNNDGNHYWHVWAPTTGPILIVRNNGKVGIRTTSPQEALDVNGNITATGFIKGSQLCIGSDCRSSWPSGVTGSGAQNNITKWTGANSIGNSVIYESGGKVGIGTTNPQQALDVRGNVSIPQGKLIIGTFDNPQQDLDVRGSAFILNSLGIGHSNPQQALDVNGNITATGFIKGSQLCIGSDCRSSWPSGVSGSGTANYITKWTSSNSIGNSVIYENNSKVGIGTTNPQQKLDVVGGLNVTGEVYVYTPSDSWNGIYFGSNGVGNRWRIGNMYSGESYQFAILAKDNQGNFIKALSINSSDRKVLIYNHTTIDGNLDVKGVTNFYNNVNIGTTNYPYNLSVTGTLKMNIIKGGAWVNTSKPNNCDYTSGLAGCDANLDKDTIDVVCPQGYIVLFGGCHTDASNVYLKEFWPIVWSSTTYGLYCDWEGDTGTSMRVYVLCAKIEPV